MYLFFFINNLIRTHVNGVNILEREVRGNDELGPLKRGGKNMTGLPPSKPQKGRNQPDKNKFVPS